MLASPDGTGRPGDNGRVPKASVPRIVILAGPFPAHTAFINRLAATVPVAAAVRETRFLPAATLTSRAAARAASLKLNPVAMVREAVEWRRKRRRDRALAGEAGPPGVDEYRIHDLNSDDGVGLIESLAPDYIAVCGTGLLQSRLFGVARRGALNLHLGLSPRYRGSHCVSWPLYNDEPEWIGVTIHYLDYRIDAGPILAQRRPALSATDTVDSLVYKSLDLAIDTMSDVLSSLTQAHIAGVPQRLEEGRNYNAREFTPQMQAELDARLKAGYLARYLAEHGGRAPDVPLITA